MARPHQRPKKTQPKKWWQCFYRCGRAIQGIEETKMHSDDHHPKEIVDENNKTVVFILPGVQTFDILPKIPSKKVCATCKITFEANQRKEFQNHMISTHHTRFNSKQYEYFCQTCEEPFNKDVEEHMSYHRNAPYHCNFKYCHYVPPNSNVVALNIHRLQKHVIVISCIDEASLCHLGCGEFLQTHKKHFQHFQDFHQETCFHLGCDFSSVGKKNSRALRDQHERKEHGFSRLRMQQSCEKCATQQL